MPEISVIVPGQNTKKQNHSISKMKHEECTGCGACYNICPHAAIEMKEDSEGFLFPYVNENMCLKCGLCSKICPQINISNLSSETKSCYAMMANEEIREKSSSGGIFTLLANHVISRGGYVVGAAFNDDFLSVSHILVDNIQDIEKLRQSKYLQSNTQKTFEQTKKLLSIGKTVLYTGTPCQIAGLKAYLQKDYENLITVDLLCHGTPSPGVFKEYIQSVSKEKQISNISFRSKINGWKDHTLSIFYADGSSFVEKASKNLYYQAFLQNLILRKSCENCTYTNLKRAGDITLGDFWGIQYFDTKLDDDKGTSLVFINTLKGKKIFEQIRQNIKTYQSVPVEYAVQGNSILSHSAIFHKNRKNFFAEFKKQPILNSLSKALDLRYDGIITNMWYGLNYGAVLTAYALQQFILKQFHKDFRLLYFINPASQSFTKKFADKYLRLTHFVATKDDFQKLNHYTDTFIVGSDQVFRYIYSINLFHAFLATYTDFSKKRIAFSASFGKETYDEAPDFEKYQISKALRRFDYVSVREKSGVDICRGEFNIEAEHIIDPVFLLSQKDYNQILQDSDKSCNGDLLCYILDNSAQISDTLHSFAKKINRPLTSIDLNTFSVPDFLNAIKTCDYFITDSFHGVCFALIFHKKFICVINNLRGAARFNSLMNTFNIKDCFVSSYDEIKNADVKIFKQCDIKYFNQIISTEKEKAVSWLKSALEQKKEISQEKILNELDFLRYQNDIFSSNLFVKRKTSKKLSKLEKIFSIYNEYKKDKKYKIIRILGIKIRFKIKGKHQP